MKAYPREFAWEGAMIPRTRVSFPPPARLAAFVACLTSSALPGFPAQRVPAGLLEQAQAGGSVQVIVQLDPPARPEGELPGTSAILGQRTAIAGARERLKSALRPGSFKVSHEYETIPFVAMEANEEALWSLEGLPGVRLVAEDRVLFPSLSQSTVIIGATDAWAAGYTGTGWSVAILDSGVDRKHPFLANKVVYEACYTHRSSCLDGTDKDSGTGAGAPCRFAPNECAHGTFVAGIAAGTGGVAKETSIISIQVFSKGTGEMCVGAEEDPCALAYVSDVIAGLEKVYRLSESFQIAAVNLSLGGGGYSSQDACDNDPTNVPIKAAIDNLRSIGIATVAASGNDTYLDRINTPACISSAIGVGSTTKNDVVSAFSNSADFLSLLAPGDSIRSSIPGGGFAVGSGTSAAVPHVAGAWAIRKQSYPGATVAEVLNSLELTGLPVLDYRNDITKPRIAILAALMTCSPDAQPAVGNPPLLVNLTGAIARGDPPYTVTWDFGDGSNQASGESFAHTFDLPGTYEVVMAAVDERGLTCSGTVGVTVNGPRVMSVATASDPFRLKVRGSGFLEGAVIKIDGAAVPETRYKGPQKLIAYKGSLLKAMLPKGIAVQVTVTNPDGVTSQPFTFTR